MKKSYLYTMLLCVSGMITNVQATWSDSDDDDAATAGEFDVRRENFGDIGTVNAVGLSRAHSTGDITPASAQALADKLRILSQEAALQRKTLSASRSKTPTNSDDEDESENGDDALQRHYNEVVANSMKGSENPNHNLCLAISSTAGIVALFLYQLHTWGIF